MRKFLFSQEFSKLFNIKNLLIIFTFLVAKILLSYATFAPADDWVYRDYMERLSGAYTQEKEDMLREEQERFNEIIEMQEGMRRQYTTGVIDKQGYDGYTRLLADATAKSKALPHALSRLEYAKNRDREAALLQAQKEGALLSGDRETARRAELQLRGYEPRAELFYDAGWNQYLGANRLDALLYVLLPILFVPLFVRDFESGTMALIDTSRHGKLSKTLRTTLMLASSMVLALIFWGIDIAAAATRLLLPSGNAPIQSLAHFGDFSGMLRLSDMVWVSLLFQLLGTAFLMMFLFWIIQAVKRSISVAIIYFSVTFLPYLDRYATGILPPALRRLLPAHLLSGVGLFADAEVYSVLGIHFGSTGLTVIIYLLWTVFFMIVCIRPRRTGGLREL